MYRRSSAPSISCSGKLIGEGPLTDSLLVSARDRGGFTRAIGQLGAECPDRPDRTSYDRELYCLRRYILTLEDHDMLDFPLQIRKSETPDFIFDRAGAPLFGLEHSEITNAADQREMTLAAKSGATVFSQGEFGGRGRGGFFGREVEEFWLHDLKLAVSKKLSRVYSTRRTKLLLYSNSNGGSFLSAEDAKALLQNYLLSNPQEISAWSAFDEISIIKGQSLLHNIVRDCQIFQLLH